MPETRQPEPDALPAADLPRGGRRLPRGYTLEPHSHEEGQIVYAAAGVMVTSTARDTRVAPFDRVTWTPPGFEHSHRFFGQTDARVLAVPGALRRSCRACSL